MKDFNYYSEVKIPYPKEKDFTIIYVYKKGKVLDTVQASQFKKENYPKDAIFEKTIDGVKFKEALNEYREKEHHLHNEFVNDLFEEFEVTNNKKANLCFSFAWDYGHSAGYHEVYNYFSELVELIK